MMILEPVFVIVLILAGSLFLILRKRSQKTAVLAEKQKLQDGCAILTFVFKDSQHKLGLKLGEQISIRISSDKSSPSKNFTPISISPGSFKILIIPSIQQVSKSQQKAVDFLLNLEKDKRIHFKIIKNRYSYLGKSEIRYKTITEMQMSRRFADVYILAQGNKITIAYQIIKGICQQNTEKKPQVTIFFVGGGIADFALKKQFEQIEQNNNNVKYFYSLPVQGQRLPSIAGLGISSQKIQQTFITDPEDTFCILCAEQNQLSVTAQRCLLNKKVPIDQIFKY